LIIFHPHPHAEFNPSSTPSPQYIMAEKTPLEYFEEIALRYEATIGGFAREVARHIIRGPVGTSITTDSVVLDNACGPAVVTEEILFALPASSTFPTVHAVDISPAMIGVARSRPTLAAHADRIYFGVMPGETLDFPDETFTHSVTNLGIFFFVDAAKGAQEVFRTLKPGGVAALTCMAALPHVEIVQRAQAAVRPDEPPYTIPINPAWTVPSHIEGVLRTAGFENVEVGEAIGHIGAPNADGVPTKLLGIFGSVIEAWSAEEKEAFKAELRRIVPGALETYKKGEGVANEVEEVGIRMKSYVAIARK
jgi:ubiquinone/menaquinone biosynthesis C-methylase UbiE